MSRPGKQAEGPKPAGCIGVVGLAGTAVEYRVLRVDQEGLSFASTVICGANVRSSARSSALTNSDELLWDMADALAMLGGDRWRVSRGDRS